MSDIDDLQKRITAALDRVAFGLEKIEAQAPAGPDEATLQALEEERTANAQLEERVRALRLKSETEATALRAQVEDYEGRMAQLDIDLQRVRRSNQQLTEACAALRDANAEGVGEPHLINKAMLAELEGMRAARAADIAEASAILANLQPLVDAAGGTPAQEGN